jgi:hypothetical protein
MNGNAIYNLSHPVLDRLVTELEEEALTVANSIPYDYRISQIVEEVKTGTKPSFPVYSEDDPTPALSYDFIDWMRTFDLAGIIKETPLIGNYASTNMVPAYFDTREVVVHGASLRSPWDDKQLGVSVL